jgi:hypothetical protein
MAELGLYPDIRIPNSLLFQFTLLGISLGYMGTYHMHMLCLQKKEEVAKDTWVEKTCLSNIYRKIRALSI